MKKLLIIALATLFTVPAFATKTQYGAACGLVDDSSQVDDIQSSIIVLTHKMPKLTTLQKQQIIVGAKAIVDGFETERKIRNTEDAVEALREFSSDGVYLLKVKIAGETYDMVEAFPGDNPVSAIFNEGTLHIVGYIQDSDVVCAR